MLKKIFPVLFISLSFIFISCPHDCTPEEDKAQGKFIDNLPEWTKDTLASEWEKWNTEETAEFKKLLKFKQKESLNSDENINYRLFVTGQNLVLFFDDKERTYCSPLWIWVSEYETGSDSISIPQEKEDEFVFEGHAKSNLLEKNTEENKASVKITLLDKETSKCNYILEVNGREIINKEMTSCNATRFDDDNDYIGDKKIYLTYHFVAPYCSMNFAIDENDRFITDRFLYFEGARVPPDYDETSKTLTYELLGGTENMCRYLDIRYVNDDEIFCDFYDLEDGKKNIKYTESLD